MDEKKSDLEFKNSKQTHKKRSLKLLFLTITMNKPCTAFKEQQPKTKIFKN